jgi:hypothetical protein
MNPYIRPEEKVEAVRLTPENLTEVETWCQGSIKGTSLPPEYRCIDLQNDGIEVRAEIGDWIIKGADGKFITCTDKTFTKQYVAA